MTDYIEINKELIPYSFNISLADEIFTIGVNYNRIGDFFTVSLYKNNELICAGEKLVYGVPLWADTYIAGKYPALTIIPQAQSVEDISGITFDNLNNTVFLFIDNGEE